VADLTRHLEFPRRVRTVLLFGGSFDPPHHAHIAGPTTVARRLYGDSAVVLFIPAARSPHKPGGPAAADEHRVAMLRLAGAEHVWTGELDAGRGRAGRPSYTIGTVRRLRRDLPERIALRLLIGADQAAAFHRWKDPRAIIRLADPLVMARVPVTTADDLYRALDARFWTTAEKRAWCARLAPNPLADDASTQTRRAVPRAPGTLAGWERELPQVPPAVARYIMGHRLYGFGTRRNDKPPA
jgi:nicotinate-nucleotide adenylyltransferase